MFRRKRSSKTTFRRFRRRPLAHVRRTWIPSFNKSICDQVIANCGTQDLTGDAQYQCCTVGFTIVCLENVLLETGFNDQAKVVRVLGDLWLAPGLFNPNTMDACDVQAANAFAIMQGFLGLRKYQVTPTGATPFNPYVPRPLSGPTQLSRDFDLSESEWKKTWQHSWVPKEFASTQVGNNVVLSIPVQCNDVHTTGAPDNVLTDGSGTINIETTCNTPDCVACPQTGLNFCGASSFSPEPWHVHVDVRKRISLRENEELSLQGEIVFPLAGGTEPFTGQLSLWGNIRTLVQLG